MPPRQAPVGARPLIPIPTDHDPLPMNPAQRFSQRRRRGLWRTEVVSNPHLDVAIHMERIEGQPEVLVRSVDVRAHHDDRLGRVDVGPPRVHDAFVHLAISTPRDKEAYVGAVSRYKMADFTEVVIDIRHETRYLVSSFCHYTQLGLILSSCPWPV